MACCASVFAKLLRIPGKEAKNALLFSIPVKEIMPLFAYFSTPDIC